MAAIMEKRFLYSDSFVEFLVVCVGELYSLVMCMSMNDINQVWTCGWVKNEQ